MSHSLELALLSCALLGLRHGFDYDHLAAITDITGVQRNWREGMRLGLLYALGHALTVAALGICVIALHLTIPPSLDAIGERLVGATLLVLAAFVAISWLRHHRAQAATTLGPSHTAASGPSHTATTLGPSHTAASGPSHTAASGPSHTADALGPSHTAASGPSHTADALGPSHTAASGHPHAALVPRSRIALLISGTRYLAWRIRRLSNPTLPQPDAFRFDYSNSSVFFVGILHGLGAETPSQLLLFLLAAQLGGATQGLLGLLCFVLGLVAMNTLMTASAGGIFASSSNLPRLQTIATSLAVAYSAIIGTLFLFGVSDKLPTLAH